MESGSAVIGKEEKKKKYHIYVEEYVLSYLRRESDSLELSEIYFYGSRQEFGRKLYVYGAGRDKGIAAFAEYEPLSELVCRLTQAGPVFLVREPDGEYRTTGFQVFYDNNEAMQNYLLEWTGSTGGKQTAQKRGLPEMPSASAAFPGEEKKRTPHRAMSVQLCLILVVLVAIVITSTDSYDKMEELNRSAKEVFFAIENQEAGDDDNTDTEEKEIVIERATDPFADMKQEEDTKAEAEEPAQTPDSDEPVDDREQEDVEQAEGVEQAENVEQAEDVESAEDNGANGTSDSDDNSDTEEEALSRNITRYYEVEQGDTLYTISQKIYGDISSVEKICEVNQISDPDKIRFGQRIILP